MAVTVEGIESVEQLLAVKEISNIDNVQGWVFSKAVESADALQMASQDFDTHMSEKESRELIINQLKRSA
jgi:EAL domain-containing protein (putative c-di-GMP-specific phosphodiesterase class I)